MRRDETVIRSLLIPVSDGNLLVPGSVVAEVVGYSPPESVAEDNAPAWLLGLIRWRGQSVACISFDALNDGAPAAPAIRARVVVLKALGGRPGLRHLAVLARGTPRLVTITPGALKPLDDPMDDAPAVDRPVMVGDEPALIPDLEYLEDSVYRALHTGTP